MTVIDKNLYWDKLVDYYYDNVHWDDETNRYEPLGSINTWLQKEYSASVSHATDRIFFNDDKKYTWFVLRWS